LQLLEVPYAISQVGIELSRGDDHNSSGNDTLNKT